MTASGQIRGIVGPTSGAARSSGPCHLIIGSVGGATLGAALSMLHAGGTCVAFGVSEGPTATFESGNFFRQGGVRLYGLFLFDQPKRVEPASEGLALLARLDGQGVLKPRIEGEAPWTDIASVARQLLDRDFSAKAVPQVS